MFLPFKGSNIGIRPYLPPLGDEMNWAGSWANIELGFVAVKHWRKDLHASPSFKILQHAVSLGADISEARLASDSSGLLEVCLS